MTAELYWAANTEQDLHHYNLYYGTQSGVYTSVRQETNTSTLVQNLQDGIPYYFALTAVDTAGNESGFSAEVTKVNRRVNRKWRIRA